MTALVFGVLCGLVGAWLALGLLASRERARRRALEDAINTVDLRVESASTQREVDALHAEFVDYLNDRGVPVDGGELAQIFANWLANRTGATVLARELDGEGIVIAIPDATEEE